MEILGTPGEEFMKKISSESVSCSFIVLNAGISSYSESLIFLSVFYSKIKDFLTPFAY